MKPPSAAIVLIEDDEVTLELYQRELCKSFDVLAYSRLDGVLEVMANQDILAVVIEPEIDSGRGWGLIQAISMIYPDHPIPVIVCSTRDYRSGGAALQVTKYLTKPVLPGTLREKILDILREQEKLKRDS